MHFADLILYLAAAVLLTLAALGVPRTSTLIALALLAWILVPLISTAQQVHG